MLAFLEVPVAMAMEAVPIAGVVFVVRVPVLDKESEAKLTASALLSSKDWVLSRLGLRRGWGRQLPRLAILLSNYSGGPMAWPEKTDDLAFQERTHR